MWETKSLKTLPVEKIALNDVPFYHRSGVRGPYKNTLIFCGELQDCPNPYFGTEEKQCFGHICRVLHPEVTTDAALVIREDSTLWQIHLSNFKEVTRLEVVE